MARARPGRIAAPRQAARTAPGKATQGTAAVEFVLVLPILLGLLALVVDLGRLLADYHAVSKSVRDATRYLSRIDAGPGGLGIDCASQSLAAGAPALDIARRLVMTGRLDGDPAREPLVAGFRAAAPEAVRIAVECHDNRALGLRGVYEGVPSVPAVRVAARVPFRFSLGRVLGLAPRVHFTVERKMAHIGT